MLITIPQWEVRFTRPSNHSNNVRAETKLHVSEDDLESIVRVLRQNGTRYITLTNLEPEQNGLPPVVITPVDSRPIEDRPQA